MMSYITGFQSSAFSFLRVPDGYLVELRNDSRMIRAVIADVGLCDAVRTGWMINAKGEKVLTARKHFIRLANMVIRNNDGCSIYSTIDE